MESVDGDVMFSGVLCSKEDKTKTIHERTPSDTNLRAGCVTFVDRFLRLAKI